MADPAHPPLPTFGTYRTERALGTGSFATVWLAHDPHLDAPVAIKLLADNWSRDEAVRTRFLTEARLLRRINHPAIVTVHALGELPSGQPWFVMEWADRGTLDERTEPLAVAAAARLGRHLLQALQVVHDLGVVHRDVKPSNVLFRSLNEHEAIDARRRGADAATEQLLLGDFGLARSAAATGFTRAAGTPTHMAPEQQRDSVAVDARADLYAVGVILADLLDDAAAPVPSELMAVVDRLRSESPRDRPDTALDAAELLAPFTTGPTATPAPAVVDTSGDETQELRPILPSPSEPAWRDDAMLWLSIRADPTDRETTLDALDAWRAARNNGQVRFADRSVADAVISRLEADIGADGGPRGSGS